jgi:hypothetical protein
MNQVVGGQHADKLAASHIFSYSVVLGRRFLARSKAKPTRTGHEIETKIDQPSGG